MKDEKLNEALRDAGLSDELLDQAVGGGGSGRTHTPPDVEHPGRFGSIEEEDDPQSLINPPAGSHFF